MVDKQAEMAEETTEKTSAWKLFIQNTSFHGVRNIAPDSDSDTSAKCTVSTFFRSTMWLILVLGSIVLFGYQVGDRAMAYFRHDTNINVELVYVKELDFPAVTICNQNTFRLTKTVEDGMFEVVSDVFSSMTSEDIKSRHSNYSEFNADNFTRAAAHSTQDFIDRCTWDNRKCDFTRDFQPRMTDFGLCYTFNGDAARILTVKQSGASFGLSLLLNVEQYEYMKGPHNDAGIKILLHAQEDEPLVKDLGFAVAPGSHTLVGAKISKVESLGPPWGKCEPGAKSYPTCKASCSDSALQAQCCKGMATSEATNGTVCNDLDYFVCRYHDLDNNLLLKSSCDCGIPCSRTVYEPSLSYAQLSKYTADQIILNDPQKKSNLAEAFLRAKETGQRLVPEVASHNTKKLESILGHVYQYKDRLSKFVDVQTNSLFNATILSVPLIMKDVLTTDQTTMAEPVSKIRMYEDSMVEAFVFWIQTILYRVVQDARIPVGDSYLTSVSVLEKCLNNTDVQNITVDECIEFGWNDSADIVIWKEFQLWANNELRVRYKGEHAVYTQRKQYKDIIELIYGDKPVVNISEGNDQLCLENLEIADNTVANVIVGLEMFTEEAATVLNAIEGIQLIVRSIGIYDSEERVEESLVPCQWVHDALFTSEDRTKSDYIDAAGQWNPPFSVVEEQFELIVKKTEHITANLAEVLQLVANNIEWYQRGNLSFLDLAEVVVSKQVVDVTDALNLLQSDLDTMSAVHFKKYADDFQPSVLSTYTFLLDTTVPIFLPETIQDFQMVQLARARNSSLEVTEALGLLDYNASAALEILAKAMLDDYADQVPRLVKDMERISGDITLAMNDLRSHLAEYIEEAQVNEKFFMDNFLQVDIFYKQLSFEKVTQQKAFEFLSLVSEVGGFMGLLLGASVLTVCELIDHIVVSTKKSCRKDQTKTADT